MIKIKEVNVKNKKNKINKAINIASVVLLAIALILFLLMICNVIIAPAWAIKIMIGISATIAAVIVGNIIASRWIYEALCNRE